MRRNGKSSLGSLLANHDDVECKDARDKIYRLVGLASDAQRFPKDYEKSLLDVWRDTMCFLNPNSGGRLGDFDGWRNRDLNTCLIQAGVRLKRLLMGDGPMSSTETWYTRWAVSNSSC